MPGIEQLREHALQVGDFELTSGARAHYYVDAKRAILRPAGFAALFGSREMAHESAKHVVGSG